MLNKKIILNILSSITPFNLKLFTPNGKLIFESAITTQNSKIRFCTNCCDLKLLASINNQIIHKTIRLTNCPCQNIFLPLNFIDFPIKIPVVLTLTDSTYNLPVESAILGLNNWLESQTLLIFLPLINIKNNLVSQGYF